MHVLGLDPQLLLLSALGQHHLHSVPGVAHQHHNQKHDANVHKIQHLLRREKKLKKKKNNLFHSDTSDDHFSRTLTKQTLLKLKFGFWLQNQVRLLRVFCFFEDEAAGVFSAQTDGHSLALVRSGTSTRGGGAGGAGAGQAALSRRSRCSALSMRGHVRRTSPGETFVVVVLVVFLRLF